MSYSRILVPIDFSELSERALEQAAAMAKTLGASLTLLHVHERVIVPTVDPAFRPPDALDDPGDLAESLTHGLQRLADKLDFDDERIDVRVEIGDPIDEILAVCKDHDLAVLATHGRRGVGQFLLGSVTERTVRKADCSVLVVR